MVVVDGIGDKLAKLMIIGEAPGKEEIAAGMPFVGRAGKLLVSMIEGGKMTRNECWITNVVKEPCRDGNKNRPPTDEEINKWKPKLWEEIQMLRNLKVIVTLGKIPTGLLLKLNKTFKLEDYVGKRYRRDYTKADIIPMYHPAYILRGNKETEEMTRKLFKSVYYLITKGDTNDTEIRT